MSISVTVTPRVTPTFNVIAPICSGSAAPNLPTTSTNSISGSWNPATISNTASGTYTFTPNVNDCANAVSISVTVTPKVTDFSANIISTSNNSNNGSIDIVAVTGGTAPYGYSINSGSFGSSSNFTGLGSGTYTITVSDKFGCMFSKTVIVSSTCLFPNGISANGDGKNDTLVLTGCTISEIIFYNRWGTEVNAFKNYNDQWDGTTKNGLQLPEATYFYVATLDNGDKKTGWVYLTR